MSRHAEFAREGSPAGAARRTPPSSTQARHEQRSGIQRTSSIFATMLLAELAVSHGFWYFSGSNSNSNAPKKLGGPPPPMQGYTLRSETYNPWGAPPQYQADSGVPGMTVALPVAVPFQPQMGPPPQALEGTLHNVRLVPCLCPVSSMLNKDYEQAPQQHQQLQQQHQQAPQQQVSYAPLPSPSATNP